MRARARARIFDRTPRITATGCGLYIDRVSPIYRRFTERPTYRCRDALIHLSSR